MNISKILVSAEKIAKRNQELADDITTLYATDGVCVIAVLNGALIFAADLIRSITAPLQIDTLSVSSYIGVSSSGRVSIDRNTAFKIDLQDRDVLIVDDIFDSGLTMNVIINHIRSYHPRSVRSCVLLEKTVPRDVSVRPDFIGFHIPNQFVVGYGLDYNETFRNLPYIAVLNPE